MIGVSGSSASFEFSVSYPPPCNVDFRVSFSKLLGWLFTAATISNTLISLKRSFLSVLGNIESGR